MTNKANLVMMTPQVLSVPHLSNLIIVYKNKGLGQHTGYLGSDQGDQPIRTECAGWLADWSSVRTPASGVSLSPPASLPAVPATREHVFV